MTEILPSSLYGTRSTLTMYVCFFYDLFCLQCTEVSFHYNIRVKLSNISLKVCVTCDILNTKLKVCEKLLTLVNFNALFA